MRRLNSFLYFIPFISSISCGQVGSFKIILKPMWEDVQHSAINAEQFDGKLMHVGTITFKKRSKQVVHISKIYLEWHGKKIDRLVASLYKKNPDKPFIPIEEQVVCDGEWNSAKQLLVLNFNQKLTLGAIDIFYLVLTVPAQLEPILQDGYFTIQEQCLPSPFKECVQNEKLAIVIQPSIKVAT